MKVTTYLGSLIYGAVYPLCFIYYSGVEKNNMVWSALGLTVLIFFPFAKEVSDTFLKKLAGEKFMRKYKKNDNSGRIGLISLYCFFVCLLTIPLSLVYFASIVFKKKAT